MQQMKRKRHTQSVTTPVPVTHKQPPVEKEKTDTTTPPMRWNAHAWRTAAIQRCIDRGVFCFKKIAEFTGIPEEHVLPIFIEIQPDEPKKETHKSP